MPDPRRAWRALLPLAALACTADDTGEPETPASYDPAADFSLADNPSGPWSYGYTVGTDLDAAAFRPDTFPVVVDPMGFWHPTDEIDGYYPYVAHNPGDAAALPAGGGWALRPDQLALEAANDGRYSVVRFQAPRPGLYTLHVEFQGIHFGLSTTNVLVSYRDQPLLEALIDGYGGDPAFHDVQGDSPTAAWDGLVELGEGEPLLFAVGVGANGTNFSDTTALSATLVRLRGP